MKNVNPWAALSALCIGFFMVLLDQTIVMVAIPSMITGLHASLNSIVWVTSVYLLTYAVPILFASRLGDRFGPKRLFLFGLFVFTASSLWCALSGNVETLIIARAVQGIGAAAMTPQTLAFITRLFPGGKRGAAMGMWGGVAGLATITGPLLGGLLVDNLGWEWIFFINVPIGVIGFVLTMILVPDWQPRHAHRFDFLGILLSAAGLFCLIFGIQNGQQYHWSTVFWRVTIPMIIGAGVLLLAVFVIWQRLNKREPLLPLRIFRGRNFSVGNLANVTLGFAIGGMLIPVIIYLQSVLGMSPLASGLLTAPMSLMSGLVAPFIGRASDRLNPKYLVMTGLLALAAGLGILAWQAQPDSRPWSLVGGLLVTGLGLGFVFSPLTNLTTRSVAPQLMGAASGIFNTSRQLGAVFGAAAIGVLLQVRSAASLQDAATARASALPPQYRAQFVNGLSHAAGGGEYGGGAPALPRGLPADVAQRIGRLSTEAFRAGFTDATKATLLLPIGVLVVGALVCVLMKRMTAPAAPSPAESADVRADQQESALPVAAHDASAGPASEHGPTVSGTVSLPGRAPAPDVAVTLIDTAGNQIERTTTTATGEYRLQAPSPGGYLVIVSARDYQPTANAITLNGTASTVDVELAGSSGLVGTVRTSSDGTGVASATVTVADVSGEVLSSVATDSDGGYRFTQLPPGDYTVAASAAGRAPVAVAVTVTGSQPVIRDLALRTVGAVHGVARADGRGTVADVRVTLLDTSGHVVGVTDTDGEGRYALRDLPEGEYTMIASGYPPAAVHVTVTAGEHQNRDVTLAHDTAASDAGAVVS